MSPLFGRLPRSRALEPRLRRCYLLGLAKLLPKLLLTQQTVAGTNKLDNNQNQGNISLFVSQESDLPTTLVLAEEGI
jgi:hypothetical protein